MLYKLRSICFFLLIPLFACVSHDPAFFEPPVYRAPNGQPEVRVAILKGEKEVEINGARLAYSTGSKTAVLDGKRIFVSAQAKGLEINKGGFFSSSVQVDGSAITVNGRPYRGALRLIIEDGKITVINRIGMEEYLMGIINHEISSQWAIEAVKAQAVAARTYAYDKLRTRAAQPYHVQATVIDQVYGGRGAEDGRAIRAVNETWGEVLFYGEDVAQALFHSSCGGHTEAAADVWGRDYPYLRGVPDPYCTEAPNYFWIYQSSSSNIAELLRQAGYDSNGKIIIEGRTSSGRVSSVNLGKTSVSANELRKIIGFGNVKSTFFDVRNERGDIVFSGSGSGHGVGLCQWGAKGLAENGKTYKQILEYYYEGTMISKVY